MKTEVRVPHCLARLVVMTAFLLTSGSVLAAPPPGADLGRIDVQPAEASSPPPAAPAPTATVAPPPPAPLPRVVVVPNAPPSSVSRRTVAFAAAGVAVVGAGLATTFGILALNNKSDWQRTPTYANADKGNNDAAYADGAIALAVAAGVTSLVLFLTDETPSATPEPMHTTATFSASPFLTPHGAGGGALIHF